jgi:hypothetical protein
LVIMLSAISFRMTGSPFHITYSQGVRFIEGYKRSFILIISAFIFFTEIDGCEHGKRLHMEKQEGERFK